MPNHPSYGHMCKRINRMNVDITGSVRIDDDDDDIIIAIDSTGIKVRDRGQRMFDKWGRAKQKEGSSQNPHCRYIKTKGILAFKVADETVHDRIMKRLVRPVLEDHNGENERIKSVLYDGAYDSNELQNIE
jgi:hypothetical protein